MKKKKKIKNEFICDRCKKEIDGFHDIILGMTAGYYNLDEGSCWQLYARGDEKIICDECMHKDPKYKKLYGLLEK
jgi:hypothetical protein